MKGQTWCKSCQEYKDDEQIDIVCHPTMAQYGPIVIANGWCKDCSRHIIKEAIVDDDGLREPKQ